MRIAPREQPVFHDAGNGVELGLHGHRIERSLEGHVEDHVPAVGNDGAHLALSEAKLRPPAEPLYGARGGQPGFPHDLNGNRKADPEILDELALIADDHHTPRGMGDDLFHQKRPTPAFRQVPVRVDLVGPVNDDVELAVDRRIIEIEDADAGRPRLEEALTARRHAANVGDIAVCNELTETTNEVNRSASGAEPDAHSAVDEPLGRVLTDRLLLLAHVG